MTDTGQVPGEGLPQDAGTVEQPGLPAPGAYTFSDPAGTPADDDDLLLMPGAQGAWTDGQPLLPGQVVGQQGFAAPGQPVMQSPVAPIASSSFSYDPSAQSAPEPVQAMQYDAAAQHAASASSAVLGHGPLEPGPHEAAGRDSGSVDLGGVRVPGPSPAPHVTPAQAVQQPGITPARRPLHMGPPASGVAASPVRSLADRGPAGTPPTPIPMRRPGPPTTGPEYLDIPRDDSAGLPGPQLGEIPPQGATPWTPQSPQASQPSQQSAPGSMVPAAETVVPGVPQAPHVPDVALATPAPDATPVSQYPEPAPHLVLAPDTSGHTPVEASYVPQSPEPEQVPSGAQDQDAAQPLVPDASHGGPRFPGLPEDLGTPQQPLLTGAPQPEGPRPAEAEAEVDADAFAEPIPLSVPPAEAFPAPALEAQDPQPMGQFVPVEGTVPSTPHLAPTPPHALRLAAAATPEEGPAEAPEPVPAADPAPEPEAAQTTPASGTLLAPEAAVQAEAADEAAPDPVPATDQPVQPIEQSDEPAATVPAPRDGGEPAQIADEAEAEPEPAHIEPVAEGESDEPETFEATDPTAATDPIAATGPTATTDTAEDPETTEGTTPISTVTPSSETPESAGSPAPGYDEAEREAVLRVMRERRDIRNGFRSDPIPHEVLLRVLEAAHTAPSVGHSQPWDFVVIRSAETRRTMHELAMRQRDAYAKSLPKGRAKQFKELKIEAILDTPVNIVVTADPTRGGRHTLGRHTQPQMAPYSSALAVENLWLAARAEGLGVGWVSFFDEREMVRTLDLPDHLEVVAYLCVGYVDEFPDEPELMSAGWSKRRPLSWVVHEETYGRRALPGEDPHDLLAETVSNIRPLDAKALGEAWERQKRMTKPAGALGMLEIISAQLSGLSRMCPPPIPEPAAVAIFAGDHGVHAQGVTPWPQEVTGQMVANFLGGGAVCNAFANQVGAEVCVIDVGVASDLPATPGLLPRKVRAGTADMTTGPALTREEVKAAIEVGIDTARDLVAAGNKALLTGEMGIANTTASAALISVFTGADPAEVTGRGTGINDETLARKTDVVRRALDLHQPDPADPIGVLAAIGGLEHAALVGLLLGGASLRTPVILDGVSAGAAALVARAIAPEVLAACIAGHRSAEPGHVAALNKLGLRPLVDLDLRLGEGTGALLALPVVQSAARAMHEVATFDSAGVTEK
ncbi:nicotinate-nucleotide--dimethylbenzimidazole phosphoribosyltransferase [Streptomyces sp. NBC_01304]|uniref:nicotinate-nucleotide--dimethylbenzimidazole phosphoribosyltransferase n=1 Tax=Streptomyces sp. NBC_01304 TaxID=2903818 RepID=UPI002E14F155|nr:nicotinate-nucleotide--dimethylbenzimidazole phosphoribosyltransferase [Streptomyces sp. NBC_01304]